MPGRQGKAVAALTRQPLSIPPLEVPHALLRFRRYNPVLRQSGIDSGLDEGASQSGCRQSQIADRSPPRASR